MDELIKLKATLNLRKFSESVGTWLPIQILPVVVWLLVIIMAIVCYVVLTSLHGRYFYELLGIFYMLIFLSWLGGALTGLRLNEYLEFSSLGPYPISKIKIFIASVLGGLMDPSSVMLFGPLWGISLCIAQFSHWGWLPFLVFLNTLFVLKCVAVSQVVVFFYQYILHRSKIYRFFFSVIFPMLALLGAISIYGLLLIAIPMVESFSSPELEFLRSTAWLSSSIFILMIQNLVEGRLLESLAYFFLYCGEFIFVFICGGALVRYLQFGNDDEVEERFLKSGFNGFLDNLISKFSFISSELRTLLQKDWKIIIREPSTSSIIIVQMFSGLVLWLLSYGFATLSVELSHGAIKEFLGSHGGISFFKAETIGYVWPLFYYGSLWLIGVSFANNIFGNERGGANQLFLLPVSSWQILLSKNLSLLIILAVPSLLISLVASFVGVQSWHILQSLWFSFVTSLILVFLAGNFISILFPLKIESGASQNLSRIGFGRSVLMFFTSVSTSLIGGYLSLPIILFCVYPFIQTPQYLIPFSEQTNAQLALGFQSLIDHADAHFYALLYAIGAYVVGLFFAEKLLNYRRDQLLTELNRLES